MFLVQYDKFIERIKSEGRGEFVLMTEVPNDRLCKITVEASPDRHDDAAEISDLVSTWEGSYRAQPAFSSRDRSLNTKVHAWCIDTNLGNCSDISELKALLAQMISQEKEAEGGASILSCWVDEHQGCSVIATVADCVRNHLTSINNAVADAGAVWQPIAGKNRSRSTPHPNNGRPLRYS